MHFKAIQMDAQKYGNGHPLKQKIEGWTAVYNTDIYASSRNRQACCSLVLLLLLPKAADAVTKARSTCMEHEDAHLLLLPTTSLAYSTALTALQAVLSPLPHNTKHSQWCSASQLAKKQLGREASCGTPGDSHGKKNRHGRLLSFLRCHLPLTLNAVR